MYEIIVLSKALVFHYQIISMQHYDQSQVTQSSASVQTYFKINTSLCFQQVFSQNRQPFGRDKSKLCLHGLLLRPEPPKAQRARDVNFFTQVLLLHGREMYLWQNGLTGFFKIIFNFLFFASFEIFKKRLFGRRPAGINSGGRPDQVKKIITFFKLFKIFFIKWFWGPRSNTYT